MKELIEILEIFDQIAKRNSETFEQTVERARKLGVFSNLISK